MTFHNLQSSLIYRLKTQEIACQRLCISKFSQGASPGPPSAFSRRQRRSPPVLNSLLRACCTPSVIKWYLFFCRLFFRVPPPTIFHRMKCPPSLKNLATPLRWSIVNTLSPFDDLTIVAHSLILGELNHIKYFLTDVSRFRVFIYSLLGCDWLRIFKGMFESTLSLVSETSTSWSNWTEIFPALILLGFSV